MRFEEGQYIVVVVVMVLVMVLVMSDGQPCGRQELGITTSVPQNLSTSIRRQVQFQLPWYTSRLQPITLTILIH